MRGAQTTQSRLEQRYRSLFTIGRGGMGTIEVALERSAGGFERIVALKRMLPEASKDKRKTEMFLREARLAGRLAHPNVVHAFASGELEGELFLAMEYVEGETLSAIVRAARESTGGIAPAMVAAIVADACEGLHAAHELRDGSGALSHVVHRDVSPHNVMVSYEGHVKLLDFGVAKIDAEHPLTRTGEVKGKVSYMSPEQAMGDPVDRRTDLFAVGAVLFECLTGEKMWGAGTDMEILRKLALEDPPKLASVPAELARLYAKLVQRAPADRYATAHAVAEDLRAFVARSGQRVDAPAIAAVMAKLFAKEALARQKALNDALASAAPSRVQDLRRSLAGATAPRISQVPMVMPSQRPTAPEPMSLPPESSKGKRGIVVSIVVGAVIAGGIVVATAMRTKTEVAIEPVAVPASASASAPASASASAPAHASALPTSTSRPTSTTPSPSKPPPKPAPAPTPRASNSLDVDPSPF